MYLYRYNMAIKKTLQRQAFSNSVTLSSYTRDAAMPDWERPRGTDIGVVGRVPSRGARTDIGADAGSGDPACYGGGQTSVL